MKTPSGSKKPPPKPQRAPRDWGAVFALEGEWGTLTDRTSVLPVLETLEGLGTITFVRRDIGTRAELDRYLSRWRSELPEYSVLYLGFHGGKTEDGHHALSISYPEDWVTVQDLAGQLKGKLKGCVVYSGACSLMDAPKTVLDGFLRETGARAVMGYKWNVNWVDAAAFDMIALSWLASYQQLPAALNKIEGPEYASLRRTLGFKAVRA